MSLGKRRSTFALMIVFWFSNLAHGETKDAAIPYGTPDTWAASAVARIKSHGLDVGKGILPTKVVLVESCESASNPMRVIDEHDLYGNSSPSKKVNSLEIASRMDVMWNLKLNGFELKMVEDSLSDDGKAKLFRDMIIVSKADFVFEVRCPDGTTQSNNKTNLWYVKANEPVATMTPYSCDQSSGENLERAQMIATCLRKSLGYDAVVMEQIQNMVLVQTFDPLGQKGAPDALAMMVGQERFSIQRQDPNNDAYGGAYLKFITAKDSFAVFRLVSMRVGETLGFGTKLIVERDLRP